MYIASPLIDRIRWILFRIMRKRIKNEQTMRCVWNCFNSVSTQLYLLCVYLAEMLSTKSKHLKSFISWLLIYAWDNSENVRLFKTTKVIERNMFLCMRWECDGRIARGLPRQILYIQITLAIAIFDGNMWNAYTDQSKSTATYYQQSNYYRAQLPPFNIVKLGKATYRDCY